MANAGFHFWVNALELDRGGGCTLGTRNNCKRRDGWEKLKKSPKSRRKKKTTMGKTMVNSVGARPPRAEPEEAGGRTVRPFHDHTRDGKMR